jgi:hypothetical protein
MGMEQPPGIIVDTVRISGDAAEGLSLIAPYDLGEFGRYNDPGRMAFVAAICKHLPDNPAHFPKGKWATIQHIEEQVQLCAEHAARRIAEVRNG